jgi:hypothetical protein
MSQKFVGFYVTFSGEAVSHSDAKAGVADTAAAAKGPIINNVFQLDSKGEVVSTQILGKADCRELRGLVFGPDGNLYVCQAFKKDSAILQFSGTSDKSSGQLKFLGDFATPANSPGLFHPYQAAFDRAGNLFVSSQDTNVVTAFYGPNSQSSKPGSAMPCSAFLITNYPSGQFNAGTFIPAFSAKEGSPAFTPVPTEQGGLSFIPTGDSTHSVRGIAFDNAGNLFVADEGLQRVTVSDRTGSLLGSITGSKKHELSNPVALYFDSARDTLYIGSPGNDRLFTYDVKNVKKGDFTANSLIQNKDLHSMSGIALDSDGTIYTGNRKAMAIYQWSKKGEPMGTFADSFANPPEQIIAVYAKHGGH